jgi:hypothetical protein
MRCAGRPSPATASSSSEKGQARLVSKYLAYPQIIFKSRELLLGALADLGYSTVEEGTDLALYGYHGDQRAETATLVIRRQHVGSGSNDLGFDHNANGYFPIISDFDHRTLLDGRFLPRLRVAYAERVVETVRKRLRASVRRTTEGSVVKLRVRY